MSYFERPYKNRKDDCEVPFEVGDTFYSRTDDRGIIISGNEIFRRVSGYTWSELEGAPHKLVRHPDMPKGFFKLLWDTIQSGKPFSGYIKNLTKEGRYYWVQAIVIPIDLGFLSVRIKPTCGLLAKVESIYAEIIVEETEGGLSQTCSATRLSEKISGLTGLGNMDFEPFALAKEIAAMDRHLRKPIDPFVASIHKTLCSIASLKDHSIELLSLFDKTIVRNGYQDTQSPEESLRANLDPKDRQDSQNDEFLADFLLIEQLVDKATSLQSETSDALLFYCVLRALSQSVTHWSSELRCRTIIGIREQQKIVELGVLCRETAYKHVCKAHNLSLTIANDVSSVRRYLSSENSKHGLKELGLLELTEDHRKDIDLPNHHLKAFDVSAETLAKIERENSKISRYLHAIQVSK